jgi:hypothetical protein
MKYVRFYLEYGSKANKRKGIHEGNVLALIDTMGDGFRPQRNSGSESGYGYECIAAVLFHPNSPVAGTSIDVSILRERCKRISEAKARQIHPLLFERLDAMED